MKTFRFLLLIMLAGVPVARAQLSPVTMRVEQIASTEHDKKGVKHEQKKALKIHLSNSSSQDFAGLKVQYWFFGKDVKDRDVAVKEKGERAADVKARGTEIVETPAVTSSYTEEHVEGGGLQRSRGGGSRMKAGKKVAASGDKLVGYGARVVQGGKVLAEYFSQPSFKEMVADSSR
jgi:hypothetical protein